MTRVATTYNQACLKCDHVEPEFIKVGPMSFCNSCFEEEFVRLGSYRVGSGDIDCKDDIYLFWLKKYKEE